MRQGFQKGSLSRVRIQSGSDNVGRVVALSIKRETGPMEDLLRTSVDHVPETITELIHHFQQHELSRRAFISQETHRILVEKSIGPRWGDEQITAIRTMSVEHWIDSLPLAPASKTKIKSTFSVLYNHAIRYQWLMFNPISMVRTSAKRLREKDVLEPAEFQALMAELSVRDRAMVMLAGSTGLRRCEFLALTWKDLNTSTMEVSVTRSCVRNRFGDTKTTTSRKPVPLHAFVLQTLMTWKKESLYTADSDFIFPSYRHRGFQPLGPDSLIKRSLRPALKRANISGKVIGWHSFRHSLATNLRAIGVDIKVAQELLRHANSRTTLDIYTHAVSRQKRDANSKLVELLLRTG